jgi:hypothetical protein
LDTKQKMRVQQVSDPIPLSLSLSPSKANAAETLSSQYATMTQQETKSSTARQDLLTTAKQSLILQYHAHYAGYLFFYQVSLVTQAISTLETTAGRAR